MMRDVAARGRRASHDRRKLNRALVEIAMNGSTKRTRAREHHRPSFWLAVGAAALALLTCPGCTNVLKDRVLQVAEGALDTFVFEIMRDVNTEIQSW